MSSAAIFVWRFKLNTVHKIVHKGISTNLNRGDTLTVEMSQLLGYFYNAVKHKTWCVMNLLSYVWKTGKTQISLNLRRLTRVFIVFI